MAEEELSEVIDTTLPEGDTPEPKADEVGAESEAAEGSETPEEVEIVAAGDEDQSAHNRTNAKRRLERKQRRQLEAQGTDNPELIALRNENELLKRTQETKVPVKMPKEDDYLDDPNPNAYSEAMEAWAGALADKRYEARQGKHQETQSQLAAAESDRVVMNAHYKRADELPVSGYDDKEEAVIEYLGEDITRAMIRSAGDDSAKLMFYFGTNPHKMDDYLEKVRSGVSAEYELGRICAALEFKPKRKSGAPAPESSVDGGNTTPVDMTESKWRKAYDKALDAGNITEYRKLKKEGKSRGFDISV